MNVKKGVLFTIIAALVASYFIFDLGHYFSLAYLKEQHSAFDSLYQSHPAAILGAFFALYVAVTALSLPGAAIMTLAAGALFGFWTALLLVSFASSLGATLAFLASRFLFRDGVQKRFGERLKNINNGVKKEGAFYLFTLRLVPVVPFFVINLVMGLTPIKTRTFYWVSQLGMLAGTAVGTRLMLHGMHRLKVMGMNTAMLGVDDWNVTKAMKLYEKVGFKVAKKDMAYERNVE